MMARHRTLITYSIAYLVAVGDVFRYLMLGINQPERWTAMVEWAVAGSLACFLLLMVTEPWLSRRSKRYTSAYLVVQIIIVSILSLLTPRVDYFAALFMTLILQAMHVFTVRTSSRWTVVFTAVMAILMFVGHPFGESVPLVVIMSMVYLFIFSYGAVTAEAEQAQQESERLLAELQDANQQLQEYADHIEEMAAEKERSRLARELHDAVTQTLFSASLIAETLPRSWERDQTKGRRLLKELRQLSRGALAEMRTLLLELRPAALVETNLSNLLHQLAEAATGQGGVPVEVTVDGECELPQDVHIALYRITQEALNNAVKHARAGQVTVRLRCTFCPSIEPDGKKREQVELVVSDDGRGFSPDDVSSNHLGLAIMRERAEAVGATLAIASGPEHGSGTQIKVTWKEKA